MVSDSEHAGSAINSLASTGQERWAFVKITEKFTPMCESRQRGTTDIYALTSRKILHTAVRMCPTWIEMINFLAAKRIRKMNFGRALGLLLKKTNPNL